MTAFCVYNGVPYKQGESWKVGCEKICRCDDAMNGQINCDERLVFNTGLQVHGVNCDMYEVIKTAVDPKLGLLKYHCLHHFQIDCKK
jgi:hypothetical protein